MKKLIALLVVLIAWLTAMPAFAAPLRVFVVEMTAAGGQNKDEMKPLLQTLLASRLNGDAIVAVGSISEADVVVAGTYVTIGKIFSLDAIAKTSAGKTLTRAFVQGESQDELIPAVGKLADKLSAELVKMYPAAPAASGIIKNEQLVRPVPVGEFIKPREQEQGAVGGWLSKRLEGAANLIATGKNLPDGGREIFLAENRRLSYYRQGKDMKLVAETEMRTSEKIISLDTIEAGDGGLDIYVTIIRSDELASQVWQVKGDKLVQVAENLPYFFRSISLAGAARKLYAQSMGRDADFYGDVYEATRNSSNITVKNPIKMPRYGDLYSFNQLCDRDGKIFTVAINPDGYLIVYDQGLNELWRSNDKFGGSELSFQKEDADVRTTGNKFRTIFMNQRVQVTSKGEVLVGKNDGFFVIGDARSYKKGAVYCLAWNGSSLDEKWRTKDTQNYMPDYLFDEARNELLILQTVQRPGISTRGASSLAIKKVE
ncbi:MAG: VCBS repeat-containing protein [Geobacteraceae bacterium]|nr:VCBS repeat-containing protein [Geobacteraceae bacterium]NTW78680.1 VCBS repeat-containing protein [Geobacteraceae bacterium]